MIHVRSWLLTHLSCESNKAGYNAMPSQSVHIAVGILSANGHTFFPTVLIEPYLKMFPKESRNPSSLIPSEQFSWFPELSAYCLPTIVIEFMTFSVGGLLFAEWRHRCYRRCHKTYSPFHQDLRYHAFPGANIAIQLPGARPSS